MWHAIVIVILGILLLGYCSSDRDGSDKPRVGYGPAIACKNLVKESLHDPSSAEFADTTSFPQYRISDRAYKVIVTVRAKNGFGAYRLSDFDCEAIHNSKMWVGVSLKER